MLETPLQPSPPMGSMDRLQRFIEFALFALLAAMSVMVFLNVVLRFLFNSGIPQTEELSRYAFVWLTFLGAVVLLREGRHLGMDSFLMRLSPAGRKVCRILSDVLIIGCCVLLLIGSWHLTISSVGKSSQASSFPMVLLFSVGVVTSVIMMVISLADLWTTAKNNSLGKRQTTGPSHID